MTYESHGGQARFLLRNVDSHIFSHVQSSASPEVVAFALVDWECVDTDPLHQYFDSLFRCQIDFLTLELFDADDAFHPFAFATKVQSDDFPQCHDVLRMSGEERRKWIESMDVEISDLNEREAYELVSREDVLPHSCEGCHDTENCCYHGS